MRDEFVLVKSEDELRPGMCVELRPCAWCGKRDRVILARRDGVRRMRCVGPSGIADLEKSWFFSGGCDRGDDFYSDRGGFLSAIRDRRLYRLIDDDTAADETATTRRKERVR